MYAKQHVKGKGMSHSIHFCRICKNKMFFNLLIQTLIFLETKALKYNVI